MFRREVKPLTELLNKFLRQEGLEAPLQQKRLIDDWEAVAGETVARYTSGKFIKNQTLFVRIDHPALRADLSMRRGELVRRLNESVGTFIISEIRFIS